MSVSSEAAIVRRTDKIMIEYVLSNSREFKSYTHYTQTNNQFIVIVKAKTKSNHPNILRKYTS